MGSIWKIFLLHIIKPHEFPIYDQHVYRAYKYIEKNTIEEISNVNRNKYQNYLNQYLVFFDELKLKAKECESKEIDEALWAFGKILSKKKIIYGFLIKLLIKQKF